MGLIFSRKKTKPLRSYKYKTPHGNFIIIVESSEPFERPSLSTLRTISIASENLTRSLHTDDSQPNLTQDSESQYVSTRRSRSESLVSNQTSSKEDIQPLQSIRFKLPRSITKSLQANRFPSNKNQAPYSSTESSQSLSAQSQPSKSRYLLIKQIQSTDTASQSSGPNTSLKDRTINYSKIQEIPSSSKKHTKHDIPIQKPNATTLYAIDHIVDGINNNWRKHPKKKNLNVNQDSDDWESDKALTAKLNCLPAENSSICKSYKTIDDDEEVLASLHLSPHCGTCQCQYNTEHQSMITHKEEKAEVQSNCCYELPQQESSNNVQINKKVVNKSSTSTLPSTDSASEDTNWEKLPQSSCKKSDLKKAQEFVTVGTVETKFKNAFQKLEKEPNNTSKKNCSTGCLPQFSSFSKSGDPKQSSYITPDAKETTFGVVLPKSSPLAAQVVQENFKNSFRKSLENIITKDIMQEAQRIISERHSSQAEESMSLNSSETSKNSYNVPQTEHIFSPNKSISPREPEQVFLSIQSMSANPLIVTLVQPTAPNNVDSISKQVVQMTPSIQSNSREAFSLEQSQLLNPYEIALLNPFYLEDNYVIKDTVPLNQSEQVVLSIQAVSGNPLAITLLQNAEPNQLHPILKQTNCITSPRSSKSVEETSGDSMPTTICTYQNTNKLASLLETKYNKKFHTVDELVHRPPKDVILLILNGELPPWPPVLHPSTKGTINYDNFLNSMRSGI